MVTLENICFGEDFINESVKNNLKHVFVIANPINTVVARMLINHFHLPAKNVVVFSLRGSDTSLLRSENLVGSERLTDRVLMKLFSLSGQGLRFKNYVERDNRKFVVYASWMYPEIESLAGSGLCVGSVYIEEGQQSYYAARPYHSNRNDWAIRKNKIMYGAIDYFFRDDYRACVGIGAKSFPLLDAKKKVVLDDFVSLKKWYVPKLVGVQNIGITPAPRRIPDYAIASMAKTFAKIIPDGGVVKLHPGFNVHKKKARCFKRELELASRGRVSCATESTVVELEMMYEAKILFGTRSSVSIYAEALGSQYRSVDFTGYIQPLN